MGRRFLVIVAHPDDAEFEFGGTALKLVSKGDQVKFISVCNGDHGHHAMERKELAARRYLETQSSAKISGVVEYEVFDISDCNLEVTLENRERIMRAIRKFQPDVVISHRTCDYHADHRNVAQLVQDCAYLVMVPLYCPDVPVPPQNPVFAFCWDKFIDPRPFRFDVAVPIDDVLEKKYQLMNCHASQVYEWLPHINKFTDFEIGKEYTWEEKRAYLSRHWGARYELCAEQGREMLIKLFGEKGKKFTQAEGFEISPYGRQVSVEEFQSYFL